MSEIKEPKLRLYADKLLVKVIKSQDFEKTASGIILPAKVLDEAKKCLIGTVVRTSPRISKHMEEGEEVNVGDKILFSQYAGSELGYENEEYKILRVTDIHAAIED